MQSLTVHEVGALEARLWQAHGCRAVWGAEIEFYLNPAPGDAAMDALWQVLRAAIPDLPDWERERGAGQFEIAWPVAPAAEPLAARVTQARAAILAAASAHGMEASFHGKPKAGDYGSALHVHLHLENVEGENLFTKEGGRLSAHLSDALGGLLATLPDYVPLFYPDPASLGRIVPKMHSPTTVSWGGNNRTTALRLPDVRGPYRRIEHRVACADADVAAVMGAVLAGVLYGLEHHPDPGAQTHGDASDAQYGLKPLLS